MENLSVRNYIKAVESDDTETMHKLQSKLFFTGFES